ncbi:unnamed protein product [[Candida] boidinii]|nr:unnamed protein product [[Candida] boidinii]
MKKAFRYTPILNKSSLSGLSSNEDNQTDFGEITENNDNATIIDGNESSNESVYLPRDIETRFNGYKRFANHISETFENVGGGDSCDIRSRFINGEQKSSQNETPEVQTQDESSVTPQQEQEPQQRDDNNNNKEEEEEENDELPHTN